MAANAFLENSTKIRAEAVILRPWRILRYLQPYPCALIQQLLEEAPNFVFPVYKLNFEYPGAFVPVFAGLQYIGMVIRVHIQTQIIRGQLLMREMAHNMPGYFAAPFPSVFFCQFN